MGTFLATSLLAILIITWMSGTFLFNAPQLRLARVSRAPRGILPIARNSNSSAAAARPNTRSDATRWAR